MAIRSSDQISIIDVTDAYSVMLTTDSYTFPGTTTAAIAGSVSTQINAMCGADSVNASVTVSEITKPTGISIQSDGDAASPTLTISVDNTVTEGGVIEIPVHIGDITIVKSFTFAIAFKGTQGSKGDKGDKGDDGTSVTVTSTEVKYAVSDDTTEPTSWQDDLPEAAPGKYLWTKTTVNYSDGNSTTTFSYAKQGEAGTAGDPGTSITIEDTEVTYGSSTSSSTQPSSWQPTMPDVPEGNYLWTKTTVTYSDGSSTTTYSYAKQGAKGDKGDKGDQGEDAITISITSSNGTIFKNSQISTVLTAHVYQGGLEITGGDLTALGTIKWYKDGSSTATATGSTLTIDAGDVTNKVTYIAQLEG